MAKSSSTITQVNGTSHLKIDKQIDSDQLLVTLSRNGKEWLSPKGWVKKEKGTLLDCQSKKDHTIIEIPAEFAKNIKSGDKIELKSREIDLNVALTWGTGTSNNAPVKKPNGAAPMEALSLEESEKRAKEAEKKAAQFRTQMEEASKAREAAQAAALLAARKADEALKAEADRIAEMERAAKAFEEAERSRMEEQRRLERERRLEEERKAEEARLAEEARIRAEAERLQKERNEARKFFKSEITSTKTEKKRLQEVLSGFKAKAESAETDIAESEKKLSRLEKLLAAAQRDEADHKASLKREEGRIGELKALRNNVQNSISDLDKSNEKLFKSLEKAESVHEKALKEVEAAKARAAEALKNLAGVKAQTDKVKAKRENLQLDRKDADTKLSIHEKSLSELKTAYDKSRIAAENEQSGIRTIKKTKEDLAQKLTSAKTDISRTLQDIKAQDDTLKRQQTSLKQIEDLENADEIRKIAGKSSQAGLSRRTGSKKTKSSVATRTSRDKDKPRDVLKDVASENSGKGGFLSRFFSRSGQDVVPAGETKIVATTAIAPPPQPRARTEKAPAALASTSAARIETNSAVNSKSGVRLNSWLLLGIATAGIAALGTAYGVNSKNGGTVTASKLPSATKTAGNTAVSQTPVLVADAAGSNSVNPSMSEMIPQMSLLEDIPSEPEQISSVVLTKPSTKTEDRTSKPVSTSTVPEETAPQGRTDPAPAPVRRPARTQTVNYEAVTIEVQEQLSYMGFYNGPIDGQQTVQTQTAMAEFKALYDLPADNNLSGTFLNTLKRAYNEQVDLRAASAVILPSNNSVVQVVENTIILPSLNSSPINGATSVDLQSTDSVQQQVLESVRDTGLTQPTNPVTIPSSQKSAELTVSTPTQIADVPIEDSIVPAKVVRKARAEYPSRLARQNKFFDAKVYVTYDVDTEGRVVEATVKSVDFDGSPTERKIFERAAVKAVKAQRFEPRTVNGESVVEVGRTTRISFNAE